MKWGPLAAFALLAGSAIAADHADGPAAKAAHASDINDVFTWMTDDNSKLIVAMTVGGNPGMETEFSDAVQFVFHIGRADTPQILTVPSDWTNLICEFESNTEASCYLGTPGEVAVDSVTGDLSASAGLESTSGDLRVHAGNHADPFFFYLGGFNAARGSVLAVAQFLGAGNFEESGCINDATMATNVNTVDASLSGLPAVPVSTYLVGQLQGTYDAMGAQGDFAIDNFGTNNALAIVAEIDKAAIGGTGEFFHVWASTNSR
jgi:hypothetical protein